MALRLSGIGGCGPQPMPFSIAQFFTFNEKSSSNDLANLNGMTFDYECLEY